MFAFYIKQFLHFGGRSSLPLGMIVHCFDKLPSQAVITMAIISAITFLLFRFHIISPVLIHLRLISRGTIRSQGGGSQSVKCSLCMHHHLYGQSCYRNKRSPKQDSNLSPQNPLCTGLYWTMIYDVSGCRTVRRFR